MFRFGGLFVKQAFRLSSASIVALVFILGAIISVRAQLSSATPDSFVLQITSTAPTPSPTSTASPTPTPSATPTPTPSLPINSYAWDMSRNGRFVVIESSGDIASTRTAAKNNADGNREIFLFDYAQRRVYQITNTRSALKDAAVAPTLLSNIDVEVSNNRPALSPDGQWIVFQSNAYATNADNGETANRSPRSFDGNQFRAELKADGNQEIYLYRIPSVTEADLTSGSEVPGVDLSTGNFFRITRSAASRQPQPGTDTFAADVVDDNRYPMINRTGTVIAFVSTRDLPVENAGSSTNADGNAEIFVFRRNDVVNAGDTSVGRMYRITTSQNPANSPINLIFNANPSLSDDGSLIAFASTADYANSNPAETAANQGNAEIYTVRFNGSAIEQNSLKRITATPPDAGGRIVNILSPGRRVSPDGRYLAFESTADFTATGGVNGALREFFGTYLYNIDSRSFTLVGPRATSGGDVLRFPTFTGDSSTIVFASGLNFRADGTAPTSNTDGLNPNPRVQLFSTPVNAPTTFRRLTDVPSQIGGFPSETRAFPGETTERMAFSYARTEFGGGNADASFEAYYLLSPRATNEVPAPSPSPATNPFTFFTGATLRPVTSASPLPADAVTGLAPGMLGVARATTVALAPSEREVDKTSAGADRMPQLPVELNGVSVAINNAAAGLYFVSPTQINFVVPIGLAASATPLKFVVYNRNTNTLIRGTLQINAASPDIFSSTNGAGGRAAAINATPCAPPTGEPFPTQTTRPRPLANGTCSATETETTQTQLLILMTGIRNVNPRTTGTPVSVQIRGAKDVTLTGDAIIAIRPSNTAGFDELIIRLPEELKGSGDSTIVVTVNIGGATFTSRAVATAPRITIQ